MILLNQHYDKVVLFTRPRRFGKTLNMSMLQYFLSIKKKIMLIYLMA
ncbi:MAG: AAA family ATPase [Thomasclavelia spiroformis]